MVFIKGDMKTIAAARKGAKARRKPYYHFRELKRADPEALKNLQRRGGKIKATL